MRLPDIRLSVYEGEGYLTETVLTSIELEAIRADITAQWQERVATCAPQASAAMIKGGMLNYHRAAHLIDHKRLWQKQARILPESAVSKLRTTSFFRALEWELGPVQIAREERIGWEEAYWRLVRPNEPEDVGPIHADKWFWDLGYGETPPQTERIKVWMPIFTERGANTLLVVPKSHQRDWLHSSEVRDGQNKPKLEDNPDMPLPVMVSCAPGDAVLFHDRLLHGGSLNRGKHTRVSLEFTLLVPRSVVFSN